MKKKLQLNAVTVTYTKTLTFLPTDEMFINWGEVPTQKGFEDYANQMFCDELNKEVRDYRKPLSLTTIKHPNSFDINFEELEEVEFDSSIFDDAYNDIHENEPEK